MKSLLWTYKVQRLHRSNLGLDYSNLPTKRFHVMGYRIKQVTLEPQTIVKTCLSRLGHLTSFARVHVHCLQTIYSPEKSNINAKVTIPAKVLASLTCWTKLEKVGVGIPFLIPTPVVTFWLGSANEPSHYRSYLDPSRGQDAQQFTRIKGGP